GDDRGGGGDDRGGGGDDRGGGGDTGGGDLALRSGSTTYARVRAEVGGTMAGSTRTRVAFATGATTTEQVVGGRPPRLVGTEAGDVGGTTVVAHAVDHDAEGRVSHLDRVAVVDDPAHRLAGIGDLRFEYDGEGRLATGRRYHGALPMVTSVEGDAGHAGDAGATFDYDADGRRVARHDGHGTTRYRYDLFDQLAAVERPDGARVSYHYDGFGRLVGRTEGTRTVHYLVGIDGHRMAEADGHGRVTRSYLWLGDQCVARVDGPVGGPLAATFHRGPCGRPAAVGDAEGRLTAIGADDPFGADCVPVDGEPGFGGLFGDPATGLLHASSRWLDPASAQFLTPDTWFGEDAARRAPAALRRGLDHLPGGPGTAVGLTPAQAYAWCGYDPLNAVDPTGHNWFGLIFTTISSLLWGMQATSLALEMWVIDFILDIIQVFPLFRPAWDKDGYWETSFFNMAAPTASYRLMVPFAFWFNGLLRGPRAFTMGNVVWAGANSLRDLETTAARDVVKCPEIATTVTATTAAAAGMVMRARNPGTLVTGSVAAATLDRVTGGAVGAPAGAPLGRVLAVNDVVAVKIVGATTDELRQVTGVGPPIVLDRALPAAFGGRNVEVRRLDPGILRLTNGDASLARTVALVRGQTAHFATQVPERFFASDTVTVDEFLPSGAPLTTAAAVAAEQIVVNLGAGAGLAPYVTGDGVRILSGGTYFARAVEGTRAPESLVLDVPLPAGLNTGMEVARLVAGGGSSAGQTSTGDRVTLGPLTAVSAREGLAITNTGAPVATVQRRIVLSLLLDCTIAPLPASMQGVTVSVAALTPDPGTTADGKVAGTKGVTTTAGGAARFSAGQAVEVKAKAGGGRALAIVQSANVVPDTLSFAADLAGLAPGTAVTVTLLASSPAATFQGAGPVAAPGDHVVLRVPSATAITANQVLQVGSAPFGSALGAGQLREVTAAPVLLAELDSALPASHTANLSVERLTVDASSVRTGASAPLARIRVTVGAANPFAVGNIVHILDTQNLPNPGQEIVGEIATIEAGGTLVLKDPTTVPLSTSVIVQAVTATGITGSGTLGESKVMIPSDPGEDPLTRRQALQNHEMRHVFQYAIWGPFFLSLPITWLVNVGFSLAKMSNSA
ncbi:MAG: hypothetical protein QOI56_936, partial [Actinomycetota bacterium]|nr:hypothetical protein [Actinomycetota bacterium]